MKTVTKRFESMWHLNKFLEENKDKLEFFHLIDMNTLRYRFIGDAYKIHSIDRPTWSVYNFFPQH